MIDRPATAHTDRQEAPAMSNTTTELATVVEGQVLAAATREEAEARRGRIRIALEVAIEELLEAWRRRDYEALGYGTGPAAWRAYLDESYGDLRFALPADVRQDRALELRREGLPVSAIRAIPGQGGTGTVARDLAKLREDGRLDEAELVDSFDGRRRKARQEPATAPAAALTTVERVVLVAQRAGSAGVTTLDVMRALKWRQGPASAAMSRAARRGRLEHAGAWRDGFGVYSVPTPALGQ